MSRASSLRDCCSSSGPDCCRDFLLLFGRRQDGGHAEGLDPELARPAHGVVEVLVFLVLDLAVGFLQRLGLFALQALRELADELPVQVVLRLGEHDAFRGDELGATLGGALWRAISIALTSDSPRWRTTWRPGVSRLASRPS